jgi:hypothetical protein
MAKRSPTVPGAFSEVEEEFFRAGESGSQTEAAEPHYEDDEPSLWRRLFRRQPRITRG